MTLQLVYHNGFVLPEASTNALTPPSQEPGAPLTGLAAATAFLDRLRPEARPTFLALRALVSSLGPDVDERAAGSELVYQRRGRPFALVRAHRSTLTLVFPAGLALEDPMGRLMRRGEERVIPLDGPENIDGHVQEFVRKAYALLR